MRIGPPTDSAVRMSGKFKTPADATLYDWALLALIVAFGGSAFVMIRNAVETVPPPIVAAGRIWIGAILLYALMRLAGRRLPPFLIRTPLGWRVRRTWWWMIAVGGVGNVLPFFIFPWAQQYVESGLAGVYMAFMPIWTIALAYFFANEPITGRKLVGFAFGFIGIVVLMGPDVLKGVLSSDIRAQGALLFATFLYGVSAVLARRAPPIRPRIFAAGMMVVAAIMATPAFLFYELKANQWAVSSILSVIGLGVFPTGINGILIIMLIRRAGAGFMALTNYVTPLWAVAMGAVIYQERLELSALIALGIILIAVAIAQRSPFHKRREKGIAAGDAMAGDLEPIIEKSETEDTETQTKN